MKLLLILMYVMYLPFFCAAQKSNLSYSLMAGVNHYNIKGGTDIFDKTTRLTFVENERGYSFGVGATLNQPKRSFWNMQVLYSTLSCETHVNFNIVFNDPADSTNIPVSAIINAFYVDIPVSYGYHFIHQDSSNFRFYTQFGVRPSFLVGTNNTITAINGDLMNIDFAKSFSITPFVGLGFGYEFSPQLSADICLFYNQHYRPYVGYSDYLGNNFPLMLSLNYKP